MKKRAILLILISGLIFSACKKEYSVENANITTANFTAVINGVEWSASKTNEGATLAQGMLNIYGISPDSQEISITLTDTTLGVHALSPQTSSLAIYGFIDSSYTTNFSTSAGTDTTQAGGEVTLTAIDQLTKTVSGTFAFKVYRASDGAQRTIATGVFSNIPYTTTLPGTAPTDTVTASIDGAQFASTSIQASTSGAQLTILGSISSGSQSIALIFPANAPVGSHALTTAAPAYSAVYDFVSSSSNTAAPANAGAINILENNTSTSRIRGSFSFTTSDAGNNHAVTGGYFSVYYGQ